MLSSLSIDSSLSPYSDQQVRDYLNRINYLGSEPSTEFPPANYDTLCKILFKHCIAIPFGALSLVYYRKLTSPDPNPVDVLNPYTTRGMNLDPESLFNKLVVQNREGYCLEHNSLLRYILQHLGFNCYNSCGRMVDFEASKKLNKVVIETFSHWIIIVELNNQLYLVDGGFGSPGPTDPISLNNLSEHPKYHRIVYTNYNQPQLEKCYFVEWANKFNSDGTVANWRPLYAFQPSVFTDSDRDLIHFYTSRSPQELFQQHLLLVKATPNGSITLMDNTLTIREQGKPNITKSITTESKRRAAFNEFFNIKIDLQDQEHLPLSFGIGQDPLEHTLQNNKS